MKAIRVIENYCKCKITEVTANFPTGKVTLYKTDTEPTFTASVNSDNVLIEIKYSSEKEISGEKMQFAAEMIGSFAEYLNKEDSHNNFSASSEKQPDHPQENNDSLFILGSYAASIVHEIKNPLISIGGFAKRLVQSISDPKLQKMAQIISSEAHRLERLAEDILTYSKKQDLQIIPIDLAQEMADIKSLFEIRSKDLHISLNFDVPQNATVYADKNKFHQVLVNLVANAMCAIGEKGCINITFTEYNNLQTLTVSDTGGGIPEENLSKIFEPFFTTSPKGTGLGLVITKKIMTDHGGDIAVKNGKDGAEITLTLPKGNL